jgi:hypothetical protein
MTFETRLAALRRRRDQLNAQLDALTARQRAAERREATRRKIILGGLLLVAAGSDAQARAVLLDLAGRASARDRLTLAPVIATLPALRSM